MTDQLLMKPSLDQALSRMRAAVQHDTPTMFWAEAMADVSVILECFDHSHQLGPMQAARSAICDGRYAVAIEHLQQVLVLLAAQSSEHVIQLADLLVAFERALNHRPFLWLETGYNRVSGWMVTVYDKANGIERIVVQVEGLDTYQTCHTAAHNLRKLVPGELHV